MADTLNHSGVLVVRAWIECANACTFRARVSGYHGESPYEQAVASAATVDELCDAVRLWLEELLRAAGAAAEDEGPGPVAAPGQA
jgi:hypothetical protein